MRKIFFILLGALELFAASLQMQSGSIAAHTEMVMDKTIDPFTEKLAGEISMDGSDIGTLKGRFWVDLNLFSSDNKDRDKHMFEALESKSFTTASYEIVSVEKKDTANSYTIKGTLDFHGVKKELIADATITVANGVLNLEAKSMINMPDYGVTMPCMVFMCVRDQVDLLVKAQLKQ
jgi:polyisoprenoid-binding protein YceI